MIKIIFNIMAHITTGKKVVYSYVYILISTSSFPDIGK